MKDSSKKYKPEILLNENEKVQQIIINGIKKRYMMNEKQAILKFKSIRSYLTEAHSRVTQKYREKNEEK